MSQMALAGDVSIKKSKQYSCEGIVYDSKIKRHRKCKSHSFLVIMNKFQVKGYCKHHARDEWIEIVEGDE